MGWLTPLRHVVVQAWCRSAAAGWADTLQPKIIFLQNGRRISVPPIAQHPGAQRREGCQAVSPRRAGFLGPNGVEPVLGALTFHFIPMIAHPKFFTQNNITIFVSC